jgi:hypothetical protein
MPSARDNIADDDAKARAMAIYKAKGRSATLQAAGTMKSGASMTRDTLGRNAHSDSESSLSSESEISDSGSELEESPRGGGGGGGGRGRGGGARGRRRRDDSLSDTESDEGGGGPRGFTDDTFGTGGAQLVKKKRQRAKVWLVIDKLCPCCGQVAGGKYAVGDKKADPNAKIYEAVDNTLEPVMRLLSLVTMGVPSTESSIPFAHLLPLLLSSCFCFGGTMLFASDWFDEYPLNSATFFVIFALQVCFLAQGSRYFRARAMSTLVQELEGRSWNWTRQLPLLLKYVNRYSGIFLVVLTVIWFLQFLMYFYFSGLEPVGGLLVFYVSRVLFGFYMNGVLFCMPVLFALEAQLVAARTQAFTEAIGKFPNLDSAIEEHIEIWRMVDRLSRLWGPLIAASAACTGICAMTNIHYLLGRHSQYFLQNMVVPGGATFIFLHAGASITARCQHTAVHLSGYRSSSDIFLAPLERIDFLTYLQANDPGFRVLGVKLTPQGVHQATALGVLLVVYLYTLQYGHSEEPAVMRNELVAVGLISNSPPPPP